MELEKPISKLTPQEYEEYYKSISVNYPYLDNWYENGPHWHRTSFILKHVKSSDKVLDVGCSNGGLAKFLTDRVGCSVFAFDIAPFFAQNAQQNAPKAICAAFPVEKTPFVNEVFDVIIAGEVLEHVLDINIAITELLRVLKKGGLLITSTPRNPDDGEQHIRYVDKGALEKLLPNIVVEDNQYSWLGAYRKF